MDYRRFVELREPACDAFEESLERARGAPRRLGYAELEGLAVRYRQLLHDHALARARFPGTAIARRLERLVLAGTHWLQRDRGEHLPTLRRFFSTSFPRAMHRVAPRILIVTLLFFTSALLGFSLATVDPGIGSLFLSPDMLSNLERGKLWIETIFAVTPGSVASSKIATNNLSVAITGWAGGALAGLGTLWVSILNGVMLGAVFGVVGHFGLAGGLGEFIAAHGPLEITCILVTAAAGLDVGWALVVSGDRPRAERLQDAGRNSLIVLVGCLPWILLLGFVEGFVSPSEQLPLGVKIAVGLALEAVFLIVAWGPWFQRERDTVEGGLRERSA